DGAQRAVPPHHLPPQIAAARLAARGTILDATPIGSTVGSDAARDLAIGELIVPDQIFARHEVDVRAVLRQRGFSGDQTEVELITERFARTFTDRNDGESGNENERGNGDRGNGEDEKTTVSGVPEVIERRRIPIPDTESTPIRFAWRPETTGCYRLTLRVAEQPGELDPKNNEVVTFLDVLDGGIRVLYVEGFPPRAEQKYIVRALSSSPEIDLAVVHLRDPRENDENRTSGENGGTDRSRGTDRRPMEMIKRLGPDGCNVILIGDLDANSWNAGEMDQIVRLVSEGAGIGFLGGFHSFGPGGYADTPLAALIPVRMNTLDRLRPGEVPSPTSHLTESTGMRPVPAAMDHPSLKIGTLPEATSEPRTETEDTTGSPELTTLWAELPPLDGANRWDESTLKPAARRILESEKGEPLLVTQDYGRGRVWAFAGDSTWRWAMEGAESAHTRFWRQTVLWLAGQSGWSDDPIRIRIARRQTVRGSPSEISVKLRIPEESAENATYTVSAELVAPDGTRSAIGLVRDSSSTVPGFSAEEATESGREVTDTENTEDTGFAWSGVLPDVLPDGDYRIDVVGYADGRELGRRSTWVVSRYRDLEMEHTVTDPQLLEQIATATDGRLVVPEEVLPRMKERLTQTAEKSRIIVERPITLWDHWAWLLVVTVLLGTEWTLRRRWGLF
ncbi:MAG: hypothetical protein Q4C47_05745, partial [Planctomycetia bacterium]|nr:hypothetical protein [Planctomycetia bacterium]